MTINYNIDEWTGGCHAWWHITMIKINNGLADRWFVLLISIVCIKRSKRYREICIRLKNIEVVYCDLFFLCLFLFNLYIKILISAPKKHWMSKKIYFCSNKIQWIWKCHPITFENGSTSSKNKWNNYTFTVSCDRLLSSK